MRGSWNRLSYSNTDIYPCLNARNCCSFTLQWYLEYNWFSNSDLKSFQANVLVAHLSWTVSHHVMAQVDNNWVAQFTRKSSGILIWIIVFSSFLIHLFAISASCSLIYNSQPISLMLLTGRTSCTTLLVVAKTPRVACGADVVGTAWVVLLTMPSITILTI